MTKIRKYNGVYKLPIKKHTKVRRPESKYRIAIWGDNHSSQSIHDTGLVKDISKGLENPLNTTTKYKDYQYVDVGVDYGYTKQQKGDWSVTLTEMSGFEAGDKLVMKKHKPSLLTKVKERFGRDK